jgi:putative tricarboxylic transport membrane protein
VLRKLDFPLAPAVLALILGPFMEKSLRTTLEISGGDFSVFLTRPLCAALMLASAAVLVLSTLRISTVRAIKAAESA